MLSTCCCVFNDMGVDRVNEISLRNACFTLQALTLEINEELGFRSSNGVAKKTHISFPRQQCQNVTAQTSRSPRGELLG